ncbi:basic amino acid/polyamine antiporter [Photobacterium chitinilyticum]|uniref:Amino acid permease n=1 Tax=Photobacterium chitinilyticum TaxID=2485123 RepID=A0A444JW41_9GAMM|nr:basic amino acid/polyamine antiporter [Photobacterium chitinilyticum]RWX57312.1 amino acid permease [Photobacterium chitinilyticum]
MTDKSVRKLGLLPMTALVTGAIVGSGIFSLPQNMAEGAGAGAIIIAWVITFFGMVTLAKIFQWLSINRSDIEDGVYGYVREGFGDYLGFNAAWGYWISVWVGNVGYLVVMYSALGSFQLFDFFGNGSTFPAMVCSIITLWLLHFFVLRGVKSATTLNVIVTVAKIIPILLFILLVALAFKIDTFNIDFWGTPELGSITSQVKNTMLYTVWVFLGIECATVYASRAKNMEVVSRATILGFLITITLLICVSLLSLGVVPQAELAGMKNPSMAQVLEYAVGPWGGMLINIGLIVSVGGALLAWTMISSEMLFLAARGKHNTAPSVFGKLNDNQIPKNAMRLTNSLITLFLIVNYLNDAGYNILIQLASSMALIPYLLCAAFGLKVTMENKQRSASLVLMMSIGSGYGLWLIYAGGMNYLLLSLLLYACGLPFYLYSRKEQGVTFLSKPIEKVLAMMVLAGAVLALDLIMFNTLTL